FKQIPKLYPGNIWAAKTTHKLINLGSMFALWRTANNHIAPAEAMLNAEECDATGLHSSNSDGFTKKILLQYLRLNDNFVCTVHFITHMPRLQSC
ncbi:MAG: hypothetical protein ABI861_11470, partial [Panacibacter sp.]